MSETIFQKIGAINKEVGAIDKSRKNEQQGFMFRGIEDFMNELHTLFAKHGVFVIPSELEHIQETYDYKDSRGNDKVQFRSRIHMSFKFVSTDDGSELAADGWGEAADNGDKGYNKCKSIALKYVLMQMFLVPTKDIVDPDAETPAEVTKKTSKKKPAPAPAPAPAPSEDNDLDLVRQLIREAKTQEELLQLWKDWPEAHEQLKSAFTERRKQLGL